jgi:8-oxo-dGTP pyrophosphatase MutT (NUDIX family)
LSAIIIAAYGLGFFEAQYSAERVQMTSDSQLLLETKWFRVVARPQQGGEPYYMLELQDYVTVVAITSAHRVLFVRQFRPVVQRQTLELPGGHVDSGESPEDAARRELLEETGFDAPRLELLGALVPDVGRLANRMWCYFASGVTASSASPAREPGVSVIELPDREVLRHVSDGSIDHALNLAALLLAAAAGKLPLAHTLSS